MRLYFYISKLCYNSICKQGLFIFRLSLSTELQRLFLLAVVLLYFITVFLCCELCKLGFLFSWQVQVF